MYTKPSDRLVDRAQRYRDPPGAALFLPIRSSRRFATLLSLSSLGSDPPRRRPHTGSKFSLPPPLPLEQRRPIPPDLSAWRRRRSGCGSAARRMNLQCWRGWRKTTSGFQLGREFARNYRALVSWWGWWTALWLFVFLFFGFVRWFFGRIDLYDFCALLRVTRLEVQAACHVGVLCLASSVPKVQQENSSYARMQ